MEGGKEEKQHDESEKGVFSHLVNDQGAPGQNPPHGAHPPPPQLYPTFGHAHPPGVYPPPIIPAHHTTQVFMIYISGHRMEAMLAGGATPYGAHPVGYGGCPFSYSSHGFWKRGKFKHRGGKFRHGKNHGGRFRKWK